MQTNASKYALFDDRSRIFARLKNFASIERLDCYYLHATKDHYLLPEDIINEYDLGQPYYKIDERVDSELRAVVNAFDPVFQEHYQGALDAIENDPDNFMFDDLHWVALRNKAQECLKKLNFDLKKWEDENIKWSDVGLERPEKYKKKSA